MRSTRTRLKVNWSRGRLRIVPPEYFDRSSINVNGLERTFWTPPDLDAGRKTTDAAPPPARRLGEPPPLLIAFHGLNSSGSRLAWWSGLDRRGPAAGFHCIFPDALKTVWDDHGCGRRDGADDEGFIAQLVEHAAATGAADANRVFVTGVSSGATFAERLARAHAITVRGMALVVGTARVASRQATAIAQPGIDVMLIAGTDDPMLPYEGGPARGPLAAPTMRSVRNVLVDASGHETAAPEALAAEWAAANGCAAHPSVESVGLTNHGFAVDRLQWTADLPDAPAVTLYRIAGGGHGWPGARQYLPKRFLGTIPQGWDGTGVLLQFARASVAGEPRALPSHGPGDARRGARR